MSIPTNYTALKSEIANWLKRDDLTNDIETMIKIGEARINRIARLSNQESEAAVVMTANLKYTSLPTGFLQHISLTYDDGLYEGPTKVPIGTIDEGGPDTGTGVPCAFAVSDTNYHWDIKPAGAYELTARFWKEWDIATDSTNWLLTNNPDAYIYTALEASNLFIKKDQRWQVWKVEALRVIDELRQQSRMNKQSSLRADPGLQTSRTGGGYNIYNDY